MRRMNATLENASRICPLNLWSDTLHLTRFRLAARIRLRANSWPTLWLRWDPTRQWQMNGPSKPSRRQGRPAIRWGDSLSKCSVKYVHQEAWLDVAQTGFYGLLKKQAFVRFCRSMQLLYADQVGEVMGRWGRSRAFDINAGVRQGCVLSPRLFCCVVQWAMERWRRENPNVGFDLGDGLNSLVVADDILLFAKSASEAIALLDSLLVCFAHVGLQLNATKTVVLTNEAQPPPTLRTGNGIVLDILDRDAGHKWLGCILSARGSTEQRKYVRLHLRQPSKAFFCKSMVTPRQICLCQGTPSLF